MSENDPIDPRITKRRVEMSSVQKLFDGTIAETMATDYVREDHLEAYVADARTRWQSVVVSEEYDAGPGGYHGATSVPAGLDLPDAGVFYESTEG